MPEVEGPGAARLEGIPRGSDVLEVKLGTAPDERVHRIGFESPKPGGLGLEPLEEREIADERDLDRFRHALRAVPRRQVSRNRRSLNTAKGGAKVPKRFFDPKALTPFLTPTPESFWPSTVVGTRTVRRPRCVVAAA
jgi:hypothetical protein